MKSSPIVPRGESSNGLPTWSGPTAAAVAQRLYDWRRRRDALLEGPVKIFGEPAWDLLLDLFLMQAEGRQVSVTDGCIGSANPTTTAIRHIGRLELAGLVVRERDDEDRRRSWLRLTDTADCVLRRFFASVADDMDNPRC